MEDTPTYKVVLIADTPTPPPAALGALTSYALTCCLPGGDAKAQQHYYQAAQVEKVLDSNNATIGGHEREIAALRRYIDVFQQELLAHPELPESIHKVVYAHRQTLIVAKDESELASKECSNCAGLGCPNCHGGANGKEQAHA